MRINMLKAKGGDCFVIDFENGKCILIDGGYNSTYKEYLSPLLSDLSKQGKALEYVFSTHYDEDHITGLIFLFRENGKSGSESIIRIENVITNGFAAFSSQKIKSKLSDSFIENETTEISSTQQKAFETICENNNYKINECVNGNFVSAGMCLTGKDYCIKILTPDNQALKKLETALNNDEIFDDRCCVNRTEQISSEYCADISEWKKLENKKNPLSPVNSASISFEIEYQGKHLLFCGDSDMTPAKPFLRSHYDVIKLSHHGTYSGNECFIGERAVTADYYIVSTDGKRRGREHPDRRLLAELIMLSHRKTLYFDYDITRANGIYSILKDIDQQHKYKFKANFDYKYFNV